MAANQSPDERWRLLVDELQGIGHEENEAQGGADEFLIARYLAGLCDEQEREAVERAAKSSPEMRECIELAREVLTDAVPEPTVRPGVTSSPQSRAPIVVAAAPTVPRSRESRVRRILRGASGVAVRNWAVAASLLIVLVGGALVLGRIKSESADVLAELRHLRQDRDSIARQLGVQTIEEIPRKLDAVIRDHERQLAEFRTRQDQVVASARVDAIEKIPQRLSELEAAIASRDDKISGLLSRQKRIAESIGVESFEEIPDAVATLRDRVRNLGTELAATRKDIGDIREYQFAMNRIRGLTGGQSAEEVVKQVETLKQTCGRYQSPAANENACVACRAPCVQATPTPCVPQTVPCALPPVPCCVGDAVPCAPLVSQGHMVPVAGVASYGYSEGWRAASDFGRLQVSAAASGATYVAAPPTTTRLVPVTNAGRQSACPSSGMTGAPSSPIAQGPAVLTPSSSTVIYAEARNPPAPGSYTAARPTQATTTWTPASPPTVRGPIMLDDSGWQAARD